MKLQFFTRPVTVAIAVTLFAWCSWYLYTRFQWPEIFVLIENSKPVWLFLGGGSACALVIVLRAWRWLLMVRTVNSKARFCEFYWITAIVVNLALITPAQLGETMKIEMLKRREILDRTPGLGSYLMERVVDLIIVAGLGATGLLAGNQSLPGLDQQILGRVLAGFVVAGIFFLWLLLRLRLGGKLGALQKRLRETGLGFALWIQISSISLACWLAAALSWQLSLRSVDIDLSIPQVFWLMSITALAQIFSFIPGGLGVAEVVAVQILEPMGYTAPQAQSGAIILRCISLIMIFSGLLHLFAWLAYKKLRHSIRLLLPCPSSSN